MKLKKDTATNSSFTDSFGNESLVVMPTPESAYDEVATRIDIGLTFVDKDQSEIWNSPAVGFGLQSPQIKKKKAPQPVEVNDPAASIPDDAADNEPDKIVLEEELSRQNLYKTELCRSFVETGICRYGHKCQFAHGSHEIRPVLRHPKYKTEVCKKFASTGHCPYGVRCRFIHPVVNTPIAPTATPSSNSTPNNGTQSVVWSNSWATPTVIEQKKPMMKKPAPTPIGTPYGDAEPGASNRRLAFFQSIA